MPTIVVEVMPKAELLDPAGKAVAGAIAKQGLTHFTAVRIGKRFELTVDAVTDATLAEARELADDLLSNGVIEDVIRVFSPDAASPDAAAPATAAPVTAAPVTASPADEASAAAALATGGA